MTSGSVIDQAMAKARADERKRIVRFIREQAQAQNHYDKINMLAAVACQIEGTEFVPDSCLGSDHNTLTRART